jgi:hypothetical protein
MGEVIDMSTSSQSHQENLQGNRVKNFVTEG